MNRARFADRDPVICHPNAGDGGQVNALTDLTHVFFVAVRSHGTHTVHPSREDGSYGEQTRVCVSLGPTGLTGRWRVIGRPAAWTQQLRGNLSHEPLRSKTKKGGRIILTFRRCRVPVADAPNAGWRIGIVEAKSSWSTPTQLFFEKGK